MKNIIFSIRFIVLIIFFDSCSVGYVSEQPRYVEVSRPPQPGNTYVWIEGNWYWNNRTNMYVQSEGTWMIPNRGRTYVPGYWKRTGNGYRWVSNKWQ
ncbi:hypothetical protein [Flavobacterium pedocola]